MEFISRFFDFYNAIAINKSLSFLDGCTEQKKTAQRKHWNKRFTYRNQMLHANQKETNRRLWDE